MRVVSWNVNGIRAVYRKGIDPLRVVPGADVVCLQETKAMPGQLKKEEAAPPGFHAHWASAKRRGYSGVALFSRQQPDEVQVGMGQEEFDAEGRVITARFGNLAVVGAYFPNSQEAGKRLSYKLGFCEAMEKHLAGLKRKKLECVLVGDFNIAHQPIDLARPKENEENPGYLPEERAWFDRFLSLGYRDNYRERHPDQPGAYTWWSYRGGARERNVGWRLDYITTTPALGDRIARVKIHADVAGSDHCPVSADLD